MADTKIAKTKKIQPTAQKAKGQILNQFEFALKRPDTYIGSIKTENNVSCWIYDGTSNIFTKRSIKYNPGLSRIIIEILSNVIDNVWRSKESGDKMTKFVISCDRTKGTISVENDGFPISAEEEVFNYTEPDTNTVKEIIAYPAEIFFARMLSGTNYNDDEERKTSGRNGLGAKAANVFSIFMEIDHAHAKQKKRYVQRFYNNVTRRDPPQITTYNRKTNYTKVTFLPDYKRFGYDGFDNDLYDHVKKLAHDCAMITKLPVDFECVFNENPECFYRPDSPLDDVTTEGVDGTVPNDSTISKEESKIVIKDLSAYSRLFFPDKVKSNLMLFQTKTGDEAVLIERDDYDNAVNVDNLDHVSFVNGIHTRVGGIHVDAWADALLKPIVAAYNKSNKDKYKLKREYLYKYFVLFIRSEIDSPSFDSQTKEKLNGTKGDVPISVVKPTPEQIKKIMKWNFVSSLNEYMDMIANKNIEKKEVASVKKVKGIEEANLAGKKGESGKCVLHITEGDSAKGLAIALMKHWEGGRDYHGALAIRGKIVNLDKCTKKQLAENEEVSIIKRGLNIKTGVDYRIKENFDTLRYGEVDAFTDQDDDGHHIRTLIIYVLYKIAPTLLVSPYFKITSTMTPVVELHKSKTDIKPFYVDQAYHNWVNDRTEAEAQAYGKVKPIYNKGLGSFEPSASKRLANTPKIQFVFDENADDSLTLAMSDISKDKDKNFRKKEWVKSFILKDRFTTIYKYDGMLNITEFIHTYLAQYNMTSISRAIPSVFDGFKEGQRKVLYGILLENLKSPTPLVILMGAILKNSAYHHGPASLESTLTKMAQGFVDSNNIPLLQNKGNFGSRLVPKGLKNSGAAAGRYTKTMLEDITFTLFNKYDNEILEYQKDENNPIEPIFYMPIIPMILVNGGNGMATAFSSKMPQFNPIDIINRLVEKIKYPERGQPDNDPYETELVPWYRGFKGEIKLIKSGGRTVGWESRGILEKMKNGWWKISELPIGGHCVGSFKDNVLDKLMTEKHISDYKDYSSENTVHIEIHPSRTYTPDMNNSKNAMSCLIVKEANGFSNMTLLDENQFPRKFSSVDEIIDYFFDIRLQYYTKRKKYQLKTLKEEHTFKNNKYKFIKGIKDGQITLYNKDDIDDSRVNQEIENLGITRIQRKEDSEPCYNYLTSMLIKSLMKKSLDKMKDEVSQVKAQFDTLKATSEKDIWLADLVDVRNAFHKFLKTRKEESDD